MRKLSGRDGIRKCEKKVLKHMGRLDVPVYRRRKTARREYVNALDTHGEDGLGESFLPEVEGFRQEMGAVEFLASKLKEGHISVIALGPMTNLATLLEQDRVAFDQIEEFVSMGGTFKKPWKLFAGSGIQLLV